MKNITLLLLSFLVVFNSCKKEKEKEDEVNPIHVPRLIFKVKIDVEQERLDNLGEPAIIPEGNAAQTPQFNKISAHYIELTPNKFTQVGEGEVIYHAPETEEGGANAIDFSQSILVEDGGEMYSIPLEDVQPGVYEYARVSVVYQNYDVDFRAEGMNMKATLASFVGFNTFITSYFVKTLADEVNANKSQGYWAWETHPNGVLIQPLLQTGQAPGTTVPNPIASTSPIPQGSCLVTGQFPEILTITGDEKEDIIIELSFSVNNSFEWQDLNGNNIFEPLDGENVVDMGLRGLIPRKL